EPEAAEAEAQRGTAARASGRLGRADTRPRLASASACRASRIRRQLGSRDGLIRRLDMSRAYRIRVRESISQELTASDEVCADLEVLEILPGDQMAELLSKELKARGFEEKEGELVRTKDGVTVTVDPESGKVSVRAEKEEKVKLETEKEGWGYD